MIEGIIVKALSGFYYVAYILDYNYIVLVNFCDKVSPILSACSCELQDICVPSACTFNNHGNSLGVTLNVELLGS